MILMIVHLFLNSAWMQAAFFKTFGHCRHVGQPRPLTTADVNRTGVWDATPGPRQAKKTRILLLCRWDPVKRVSNLDILLKSQVWTVSDIFAGIGKGIISLDPWTYESKRSDPSKKAAVT